MKLLVKIEANEVKLALNEEDKLVDEAIFPLGQELSMKLLPAIDSILKKNGLEVENLEKAEFSGDIAESYTTYRIAKVVVDTINWAKDRNK